MPLNNVPRKKLKELVTADRTILDDAQKLADHLSLYQDTFGPESFVLINTLRARLPQELRNSDQAFSADALLIRHAKRMMDELCLNQEAAWWAVESWAFVLDLMAPADVEKYGVKFFELKYAGSQFRELPLLKLREIVSRERSVIENPRKLKAFLMDSCGDHSAEVFVIISSLESGVPGELAKPDSRQNRELFARLKRRLETGLCLREDAAWWAVVAWAYALDDIQETDLKELLPSQQAASAVPDSGSPTMLATRPESAVTKTPEPHEKAMSTPAKPGSGVDKKKLSQGVTLIAIGAACIIIIGLILLTIGAIIWYVNLPPDSLTPTNTMTPTAGQVLYYEDFQNGNGGYFVSGSHSSWQWGKLGNRTVWVTNLTGDYMNEEDGYIISPYIDLSRGDGNTIMIEWDQLLETEDFSVVAQKGFDHCVISVSKDGGQTWEVVSSLTAGNRSWQPMRTALDSSYKVPNFRMKFAFYSDQSGTSKGAAVDNIVIYTSDNGTVIRPLPTVTPVPSPLGKYASFTEDFTLNGGNYRKVTDPDLGSTSTWEWGSAGDSNAWKTNTSGNYRNREYGYIVSPAYDLSGYKGDQVVLRWSQRVKMENERDFAWVAVTKDNGLHWAEVYRGTGDDMIKENKIAVLDQSFKTAGFQVQFGFMSDARNTSYGYSIDDVTITTADSV